MFQCVIVEEIIMLSSILLSWETFYRNSVQLLHFHLSNYHFQKKTCAVQKVNKRTANWFFISTKSRLYQAVWQLWHLWQLWQLCDSKRFFSTSFRKTGSTGECWSNLWGGGGGGAVCRNPGNQIFAICRSGAARKLICRDSNENRGQEQDDSRCERQSRTKVKTSLQDLDKSMTFGPFEPFCTMLATPWAILDLLGLDC